MNPDQRLKELLESHEIKINRFIGRCILGKNGHLFMGDILSKGEHIKLLKPSGDKYTVGLPPNSDLFVEGKFYDFSLYLPASNNTNNYIYMDLNENLPIETSGDHVAFLKKTRLQSPNKKYISEFLARNNVGSNRFYGKFIEQTPGKKYFVDVISKSEGNLLLRPDGNRLSISVRYIDFDFIENEYYEFSLAAYLNGENKEPALTIDDIANPPVKALVNPYKEITRLRYERLDNPEANRMIAHLMREIGKGLYSSKQRMIFELLQNADDTPAGELVSFHIDADNDYLLIMHNGVPFNQDDVEAITSAAESTKRNDRKKTGYKGIGFKSVFTDSEEVIIKSGGFQFTFKRDHSKYNDFDTFYFSKKRYTDYPPLLEEDKLKYTKQRKNFDGNTDIPWQLIPIWLDELPKSLSDSGLTTYNNNVGIAIKFGKSKVDEYLKSIINFIEKPQFMLFLRHVNLFKSIKNGITVRKTESDFVTIEKTNVNSNNIKLVYYKHIVDTIEVNDIALADENIELFKKEKTNDYGEIFYYFSSDEEGKNVVESIPPKLAAFDTTSITFAAPVLNNKIACEPEYLDGKSFSCFFTYLPMKETRMQLPFLINADFVPSSNREDLQGDNLWNVYIISKIAFNHLRLLKQIAQESIDSGNINSEYLSLLLKDTFEEESSIQLLIDKYNRVYLDSLKEVEFIITDKSLLALTSEIILDNTGLSDLLGKRFFYDLTSSKKHLPHSEINRKYLNYDYLDIEKYSYSDLFKDLNIEKNNTLFALAVVRLNEEDYLKLLDWLDTFSSIYASKQQFILSIRFINGTNGIENLDKILKTNKVIIKSKKTKQIENILIKLNFKLTDFNIDDYNNIFKIAKYKDSYLNKDLELFEKICSSTNFELLSPSEKNDLITFFKSLEGVGETRFAGAMSLFKSKSSSKVLRPLKNLISNSSKGIPTWLNEYVIDEEEENNLSQEFKKYLILESNLLEHFFCNPALFNELTTQLSADNIGLFYTYILKLQKGLPKGKDPSYSGIPWLYIPTLESFKLPAAVYCPESLLKLSEDKYSSIQTVVESISSEFMPDYSALPIIENLVLGCKKMAVSSIITKPCSVGLLEMNIFLDWCETINEKELLKSFIIEKVDTKFKISESGGQRQFFTTNNGLIESINAQAKLNNVLHFFPSELYSPLRHKIGLLENELLIRFILENCAASLSFIAFINPLKDESIKRLYIDKLSDVNLKSDEIYSKTSNEHRFFELIIELGKEDEKYFESIVGKVKVDGHKLSKKNISDDVIFKFPPKGNQPEKRCILKLSKILPTYKDETAALTKVIENFIDIKSRSALRKVFKTSTKKTEEIFNEIHDLDQNYLTPYQMLFLLLYQDDKPNLDFKKEEVDFSEYWYEKDNSKYEKYSIEFLNLLFNERYINFHNFFIFKDLELSNKILNADYSTEDETLPQWTLEWLKDGDKDEKVKFLIDAGLNNDESSIVILRRGILESNLELFSKGLVNSDNLILVKNTIHWLLNIQENKGIILSKKILKPLYKKVEEKSILFKNLPLPVLKQHNHDSYKLLQPKSDQVFHLINEGWNPYEDEIILAINESGEYVIDDVLPATICNSINTLVVENKLEFEVDIAKLSNYSTSYIEPYYLNWPDKFKYQIFIYDNLEIPFIIKFQSLIKENFSDGKSVKVDEKIFVTIDEKDDLPFQLKSLLPEPIYLDLVKTKSEFERKNKNEQFEISYSDEETKALKRLFGDEIPKGHQKDLNLNALVKGLVYLLNNGYDVSDAEANLKVTHEFSQLFPVYKLGDNKVEANALKVKCRSAKSGILYLRASSLQELKDENTYMYVLTGKEYFDCRFCKNREELIADSKADYRVMRIENDKGVSDLDDIIAGKFDPDNLWILVRVKDKKEYVSIFEKIKLKEVDDNINNINLGDETYD